MASEISIPIVIIMMSMPTCLKREAILPLAISLKFISSITIAGDIAWQS